MTSVYVKTLGCKVNSFDSKVLENQLLASGYVFSASPEQADVTLINSCSVTEAAEKETRYLLRRYRRDNPSALQVVTGCYAQINSSRLASMDEVDLVIPNEAKHELVALLNKKIQLRQESRSDAEFFTHKMPIASEEVEDNKQSQFKTSIVLFDQAVSDQTRAYLKVQDGCNGFCTYCQIPYARGASRSVPLATLLSEVQRLIAIGTPEIVVTGIHVGDYGEDLAELAALAKEKNETPFVTMLRMVFALPSLKRLRISSLEPSEVTPPLLKLLAEQKEHFCDHFHLPLQSGSDKILKKMRRTYDVKTYENCLADIRAVFPDVHLSADLIVGFPGEEEEDFQDTIRLLERNRLASLHVFPYSKRPNTAAARLPGHLPIPLIKERSKILRGLSQKLYQSYASLFLGRSMLVLWENSKDEQGRRMGKSRNYLDLTLADAPTGSCSEIGPGSETLVKLRGFIDERRILSSQ
ncbi:MAG: tRNA (N(6)-L-threonylcarbamoyladenosine(37)-C(2))-methylthiotransferase MtaB [Oligoflexales bacterium]|nr:tRNA (N(6)-L-threonylcarbamoyladenosine(37)-C(2))-methylthiotransferase MtaB [Oligoflexales bacterium]